MPNTLSTSPCSYKNKPYDHALKGEWNGWREFHVSGDLLLIYRINKQTLELARMGTHSELFG